jgi:hypothetical protein
MGTVAALAELGITPVAEAVAVVGETSVENVSPPPFERQSSSLQTLPQDLAAVQLQWSFV